VIPFFPYWLLRRIGFSERFFAKYHLFCGIIIILNSIYFFVMDFFNLWSLIK